MPLLRSSFCLLSCCAFWPFASCVQPSSTPSQTETRHLPTWLVAEAPVPPYIPGRIYQEQLMTDTNILAPLQSLSSACVGLVAKVAATIVSVNSRRSRSSGFIWRPGLIVTAEEALTGEGEIAI